ncbi:MAG: hypothetical protein U0270_45550 [Labilithrix sp.]
MPHYAFLRGSVPCPACGVEASDELWLQWGFCAGRVARPASTYELGEAIRWGVGPDGSVSPWTYFRRGGGNLGTPDLRDLVVRDSGQQWLHERCTSCGAELGGGAVEIRDGRIVRAWIATRGEFTSDRDYWRVSEEGLVPLPFGDEPMPMQEGVITIR